MMKSEYAQMQVTRYLGRAEEPVKLDDLVAQAGSLTDDGDPRWVGVALMNLARAGEVRYLAPGCDDNHHHNGECTVELISQ